MQITHLLLHTDPLCLQEQEESRNVFTLQQTSTSSCTRLRWSLYSPRRRGLQAISTLVLCVHGMGRGDVMGGGGGGPVRSGSAAVLRVCFQAAALLQQGFQEV